MVEKDEQTPATEWTKKMAEIEEERKQKQAVQEKTVIEHRQKLQTAVNQLMKINWSVAQEMTQEQIESRLHKINDEQDDILTNGDITNVAQAAIKFNELRANGKQATITYVPKIHEYHQTPIANFNRKLAASVLVSAPGGTTKRISWTTEDEDNDDEKSDNQVWATHFTPAGDMGAQSDGRNRFNGSDCHIFGNLYNDSISEDRTNPTNFSVVVVEGKSNSDGLVYDFMYDIPVHPLVKSIEQLQTMYSKNSFLYASFNSLEAKTRALDSTYSVYDQRLLNAAKIPADQWPTYSNMNLRKSDKSGKVTVFQKLEPSMATLSIILDRDWETAGKIVSPVYEPTKLYLKADVKTPSYTIKAGEILDDTENALFGYIQQKFCFARMTMVAFRAALQQVATRSNFNPIKEWLCGFRGLWDGKKRIEKFAHEYFGVIDTPETREASKLMFVSAVIEGLFPGSAQNYSFDFIGAQGIGKTIAFQNLVCSRPGLSADNPLGKHHFHSDGGSNIKGFRGLDPLKQELSGKLIFQDDERTISKQIPEDDLKKFITNAETTRDDKYAKHLTDTKRTYIIVTTSNSDPNGFYTISSKEGARRFIPLICTLDGVKNPTLKVSKRTTIPGDNRHIMNFHDVQQFWAEAIYYVDNSHRDNGDDTFIDNKTGRIISALSQQSTKFFATIYQDLLRVSPVDQDTILYMVNTYNETHRMIYTKTELNDIAAKLAGRSLKIINKIDYDMTQTLKMPFKKRPKNYGENQDVRAKMDGNNHENVKVPRVMGYIITDETKEICHEDHDGKLYPPVGGLEHAQVILKERHDELVEEKQKQQDETNKENAELKLYGAYEQQEENDAWQSGTTIKVHVYTDFYRNYCLKKHNLVVNDDVIDFPIIEQQSSGIDNSDSLPFDIDEPAIVKHQA